MCFVLFSSFLLSDSVSIEEKASTILKRFEPRRSRSNTGRNYVTLARMCFLADDGGTGKGTVWNRNVEEREKQ